MTAIRNNKDMINKDTIQLEENKDVIKTINGDITKIDGDNHVLVQQLNCIAIKPHGLSQGMASAYPYGDVYSKRIPIGNRNCATLATRGVPGTVTLHFAKNKPVICNLYGQYCYTDSENQIFKNLKKYLHNKINNNQHLGYLNQEDDHSQLYYMEQDTKDQRYQWFLQGLEDLSNKLKMTHCNTVIFPYRIGCGMAKGDWHKYYSAIVNFAKKIKQDVIIISKT
uniref:Wsv206-like protein n=1 Tax=Metapenaeus ensis majanivirus TaxID=2984279 RepID=A0A9C7CF99_9VIRU|nr:MAG: wsv206-like protein [Metapenaeus ensis majanivirus]